MALARAELERDGWQVTDMSATHSCDLLGEGDGVVCHVEVKGSTGPGDRILVTRGEVTFARDYQATMRLILVSGIAIDKAGDTVTARGGRLRMIASWQPAGNDLTDCAIRQVLRASHIKPWRVSSNVERLDRFNGLLLTANVDALFDRFLILFSDDGEMLYGPDIGRDDLIALGCDPDRGVAVSPPHAPYLAWHRGQYRERGGKG